MCVYLLVKYNKDINIKILYSTIKVVGLLGVLFHDLTYIIKNTSLIFSKLYYIKPYYFNYIVNSFIITNNNLNNFFIDLVKLLLGVNYGWFFSFNVTGRGFSFRLKKKKKQIFLKIKIGFSHFVYIVIQKAILIKIAKKRNKLVVFSLNYWILSQLVWQLRQLRSSHTYKIQGISFFNEKIKVKPGKKKQI